MTRNKLYAILLAACGAGYGWLAFTYFRQVRHLTEPGLCLFKRITTIPCPSCGSTRSVISLMKGDIAAAFYWNPFGLLLISFLLIAPFWILYDMLNRKQSLLTIYLGAEQFIRRKWIAIPAIIIVIMNWVWNIAKGL
ncbi:MAG: DUF2752 domain-containing protein [Candidatus Saccharibacteria bacterium]